jgi:hypothetical protein
VTGLGPTDYRTNSSKEKLIREHIKSSLLIFNRESCITIKLLFWVWASNWESGSGWPEESAQILIKSLEN